MIIRVEYQNDISAIKTKYKGKEKSHYIRFIVDEYSLQPALDRVRENKWVVGLDYEGDISFLQNIQYKEKDKSVIVIRELKDVNETTVRNIIKKIPIWVRVVIYTPEDFSDMKFIFEMSKKYPNLRFSGGKFLRLEGCNIGCITKEDIPKKVAESKIDYFTKGCSCIIKTVDIEDVEGYEFVYSEEEEKLKDIKEENTDGKIVIKNLRDLL